jgi:hypothetical protein
LCVRRLVFGILDFDGEFTRVHVREFCAVSISSTDDTLLRIIVVGTREKVSEREFRIPNLLFFVFLDRDASERPVVLDTDFTLFSVDVD